MREEGVSQGFPKIVSDIDATEVVLMLAPETNGHVAVKAGKRWANKPVAITPIWPCTAKTKRFVIVTSRLSRARSFPRPPGRAWKARRCYNAGYTNVHELIPWRTLTGRQQFYHGSPMDDCFR